MFSDPPKVQLASGQSFVSIEVEPGQEVWLGNVDIKVAFYAMQLPAELLKYFGLPYDVRARDVGVSTVLDGAGNAVHINNGLDAFLGGLSVGPRSAIA